MRSAQTPGNGLHILQSFWRFDEGHIGAGFDIALSALDRRLETLNRAGVRSGDDDHPFAARVNRGPHLSDHLIGRNQLLAGEVAAAFRRVLVLDLNRAGANLLEDPDRVSDIDRVAEAGVGIDDQRQIDNAANSQNVIGDLAQIHESEVGQPEVHVGKASASQINRLEAEIGDHPRRKRVGGAGQYDPKVVGKHAAEGFDVSP